MEEITSDLSNHCMVMDESQGQEGSPVMMAVDNPSDCISQRDLNHDCIEVDNVVPGMASQANQMRTHYGDSIQKLISIVPHGVIMLAESLGNGRASEMWNHLQTGSPKHEMVPTHPRSESASGRLQHVLTCLQRVEPLGTHLGGAAREAARPGGVVAVRAGWRRTGIRAAEGLGVRELRPGLLIPCREIARGGNTTHPLWGGDLLYI